MTGAILKKDGEYPTMPRSPTELSLSIMGDSGVGVSEKPDVEDSMSEKPGVEGEKKAPPGDEVYVNPAFENDDIKKGDLRM